MALKTTVKINHVTNLSNARYCAGMGVEMIGFDLNKHHPNFVEAKKAQEIAGWLSGVSIVGELTHSPEIVLADYPLDMLEINSPHLFHEFVGSGAPLLYRFAVDNVETLAFAKEALESYRLSINYFLIESYFLKIDQQVADLLKQLSEAYPLLIGFGVTATNVHEVLDYISPAGIALNGSPEISAGLKDFDELAEILEAIEIE
jgi:phosphoribosylanthranilate isomerase